LDLLAEPGKHLGAVDALASPFVATHFSSILLALSCTPLMSSGEASGDLDGRIVSFSSRAGAIGGIQPLRPVAPGLGRRPT